MEKIGPEIIKGSDWISKCRICTLACTLTRHFGFDNDGSFALGTVLCFSSLISWHRDGLLSFTPHGCCALVPHWDETNSAGENPATYMPVGSSSGRAVIRSRGSQVRLLPPATGFSSNSVSRLVATDGNAEPRDGRRKALRTIRGAERSRLRSARAGLAFCSTQERLTGKGGDPGKAPTIKAKKRKRAAGDCREGFRRRRGR